jgi:hypothetical protein
MQPNRLQRTFAYLALIFLPWPCFRPIDISLTYGDIFLVAAAILNANSLFQMRGFQIPFLMSLPFILITQVADTEASVIEAAQSLYIFGFVLPFGWIAFSTLPFHRVITALILSMCLSSLVAVAQNLGYVGEIGWQSVWATRDSYRGAGLSLSCSALCMTITPLFALLVYVPKFTLRLTCLVILLLGLFATLAKSAIFAIPAILYYLITEPNRRGITRVVTVGVGLGILFFAFSSSGQRMFAAIIDAVIFRIDKTHVSVWERTSTLRFAMSYLPECYFLGLGYKGTHVELTQHLGNTVHIFHVGLPLIGGVAGALLHYMGVYLLLGGVKSKRQTAAVVLLISHLLAVCTMPVLMHSFQYIPYLICGVVIGGHAFNPQLTHPSHAYSPATMRPVQMRRVPVR